MNRTFCLIFAFIFVVMVIPVFYICFTLSAELDSVIVAVVPPALCFFIACLFMYRAECLMIKQYDYNWNEFSRNARNQRALRLSIIKAQRGL